MRPVLIAVIILSAAFGQEPKSGPALPHKLVSNWAQLPEGWNFGETSGVDIDKDDNVWVFNRGKHPVIEFDKNGKFLQAWNEVPVISSHGIRVGPDGNIWAVDVAAHKLLTFTPHGRVVQVIGRTGTQSGGMDAKDGFNRPTNLAFTREGDYYVSDGYENARVVRFGRDGIYKGQWGGKGTGDSQFNIVHDVAVDANGRVYVADRENRRVQVFDATGKLVAKWTDAGSPWGLYYVARENAIYMCDGYNNRVVKLNTEGQILGVLGSYGKAPGKFDFPHSIAVDSEGSIYVAEIKNWRVQKFAK